MIFDADRVIQRPWRGLPEDAPREMRFRALRDATRESYLSEPGNPYWASGRSRGAARWLETRRLLADGIDRDGHYMDVGCANGLLLESLVDWAAEGGHGIDLVPEPVVLAQERHGARRSLARVALASPQRSTPPLNQEDERERAHEEDKHQHEHVDIPRRALHATVRAGQRSP